MTARRLFTVAVTIYGVAFLGWRLWPAFRESLIGKIVAIPPFSIYLFEHFGVPGLTDRTNCDWGFCAPSLFGIVFAAAVWLGAAWLIALGLARLRRR